MDDGRSRACDLTTCRARSWAWPCVWLSLLGLPFGCDGGPGAPDASLGDAFGRCGDGVVEGREVCDDGDVVPGDGCSPLCTSEAEPAAADQVVDAPGATGEGFLDSGRAVNGVRGGGDLAQSLDVYSIRFDSHLVLGWGGRRLVDGPGDDLAIFENPFRYAEDRTFMDQTVVEVTSDGVTWVAFPHDYVADDETGYSPRQDDWVGFAGVRPVFLHVDDAPGDPFDPASGGDAFDLADLGDGPDARLVRERGVLYVRLSPAADWPNPDTGERFVRDVVSDGPDIDGVHARYLAEAP